MRKNEIHWAIFTGKRLMSFTIRTTREQCIREFLYVRSYRRPKELLIEESCKKVVINEWKK